MKLKKGFTLIELLIVIVVIGILSAMMMLSSAEAVSSAKAARIIHNLRDWKTAALAWYIDNIDRVTDKGQIKDAEHKAWNGATVGNFCENVDILDVAKYFNGEFTKIAKNADTSSGGEPVKDGSGTIYFLDHIDKSGKYKWFIGCYFGNDAKVKEKLAARATTANLVLKTRDTSTYIAEDNNATKFVYIEIMDFSN